MIFYLLLILIVVMGFIIAFSGNHGGFTNYLDNILDHDDKQQIG